MKILILVCPSDPDYRSNIIAKSILKHLSKIQNTYATIELFSNIYKLCQCNYTYNSAIIVNLDGFYGDDNDENNNLIQLRKIVSNKIVSFETIGSGIDVNNYLDIIFYIRPNILSSTSFSNLFNNKICCDYFIDTDVYKSNKNYEIIKIMVGKQYFYLDQNNNISDFIINNIINLINKNNTIKLVCKENNEFFYYDNKSNTYCVKKSDNYIEFSETSIYFVTSVAEDELTLLELAGSNVLIVAPNNYVDEKLVKRLEIITYDLSTGIPWKQIMSCLESHNIRDKLISDGLTLENIICNIYQILSLEVHIMDFGISTVIDNTITDNTITKSKKRKPLLQSNLKYIGSNNL